MQETWEAVDAFIEAQLVEQDEALQTGAGGIAVGLISGDNTVRVGARAFYEAVSAEPSVDATAIQTVGVKGYDGFVLACVRSQP